jgi:hypothetical protein
METKELLEAQVSQKKEQIRLLNTEIEALDRKLLNYPAVSDNKDIVENMIAVRDRYLGKPIRE